MLSTPVNADDPEPAILKSRRPELVNVLPLAKVNCLPLLIPMLALDAMVPLRVLLFVTLIVPELRVRGHVVVFLKLAPSKFTTPPLGLIVTGLSKVKVLCKSRVLFALEIKFAPDPLVDPREVPVVPGAPMKFKVPPLAVALAPPPKVVSPETVP